MIASVAVGFSVIAMLSWGLGDFLIQRSSRKLGDWETFFVITAFGSVVLIPFVLRNVVNLFGDLMSVGVLVVSACLLTLAAMLEIESFRRGKMSVVEPMLPFEIPAAALLSYFILGDTISVLQAALIIILIFGLFLISFRGKILSFKYLAEKGAILGLSGAALMGAADFLLGWGSRLTDPLVSNFVLNVCMAAISATVILLSGRTGKMLRTIRANRGLVLVMSITDNIAWIGYAFAMTLMPIAVATGLSETSCIIAVCLGVFVNREKLQTHQKFGIVIGIAAALILAFITA